MNEKLLEYFKSDDIYLIQCEHKWCDAYGYEKSQMKKDLLDYITNLQQENERLNNIMKDIGKELEILYEINDINIIKAQLLNMKYRIKGGK